MAQLNTLNSLRISLTASLAMLAGSSISSAADWRPRAAVVGYSIEATVVDANWAPRLSMQVSQSGLSKVTQAGWAPRSAIGGSAPVNLVVADIPIAQWTPRSAIANTPSDEPAVVAGWAPRASLDIDPAIIGTNVRGHRNTAGTVVVAGAPVSISN